MLPRAYSTHNIKGRTRVHVPAERNNAAFFKHAEEVLRELEGIEYVIANPLTASILLLHRLSLDEIGRHARKRGLFDVTEPERAGATVIQQAAAGIRAADRRMHALTRGNVDLDSLIFLGLGTVALVQLARTRVWPSAFTLLWYAFGLASRGQRQS